MEEFNEIFHAFPGNVPDAIRTHDLPLRSTIEPLSSVFTYVQESRFSSGFFRIPNPFPFTEVHLCR